MSPVTKELLDELKRRAQEANRNYALACKAWKRERKTTP